MNVENYLHLLISSVLTLTLMMSVAISIEMQKVMKLFLLEKMLKAVLLISLDVESMLKVS